MDWTFFNPKAGARFDAGRGVSLYASIGRGGREPARSDMLNGEDNATIPYVLSDVRPEKVVNGEIGVNLSYPRFTAQVNGYLMAFHDEIAQTGELSEIGLPLRRNVDSSSRRGRGGGPGLAAGEHAAGSPHRHLTAATGSTRGRSSTTSTTRPATGSASTSRTHADVPPYVTPGILANLSADYAPTGWATVGAAWRYVGESHLDNTGSGDFTAPAFSCVDLSGLVDLARLLPFAAAAHPTIRVQVNNLLDNGRMFPNGYSYRYFVTDDPALDVGRDARGHPVLLPAGDAQRVRRPRTEVLTDGRARDCRRRRRASWRSG